jgi:hypothetical protein
VEQRLMTMDEFKKICSDIRQRYLSFDEIEGIIVFPNNKKIVVPKLNSCRNGKYS